MVDGAKLDTHELEIERVEHLADGELAALVGRANVALVGIRKQRARERMLRGHAEAAVVELAKRERGEVRRKRTLDLDAENERVDLGSC